jgi:2-dehydro-3-deoxyphosphooctonate aldolase (KDO 8-P synthase)
MTAPASVTVNIGDYRLGGGSGLFLILGPCVIESEQLVMEVATEVARVAKASGLPVLFKSSFDKANRTSVDSFRGPGLERGLRILADVRSRTGLPVVSDIHSPEQAAIAAEVLDVLQIPAFLCRQTDLLVAAARTGRAVNIKKGQFLAPEDVGHVVGKVRSAGNERILLTERGTSFGYRDLVVDMRGIPRMKKQMGFPVVFDATHSSQFPGGGDGQSSGDRTLVPTLARAAVAAGADGVFMEVHPQPECAACDGPNSLALADVESLAVNLREIYRLVPRPDPAPLVSASSITGVGSAHATIEDRLQKIKLIIFDVDGALTDGRITFGSGQTEIKSFHVRDGHGIKLAIRAGLEIALVTGRSSEVVARRGEDLGIQRVYQGIWDKRPVMTELMGDLGLSAEEVAVLGDDVVDIPLFRMAGAAFTVPEAPAEVRDAAHCITVHRGGDGAAREVVELILKAQGKWQTVLARYYQ